MQAYKIIQVLVVCLLIMASSPVASAKEIAPLAIYHIEEANPDAGFHHTEYKMYPGPIDGLASQAETWTGFFRQGERTITIDLGLERKVTGISLEFQQNTKAGILFPEYIEAHQSLDKKQWNRLGRVHHRVPASDVTVQTKTMTLLFPGVTSRYLQITFPVEVWAFARHLSIKEEIDTGVEANTPIVLAHSPDDTIHEEKAMQIPGINHILLIYSGEHGETGTWNMDDFLPMIAYTHNGFIKGRMFDTMLFLPYPEMKPNKEGWTQYLDDLFQEGVQLQALNDSVLELKNSAYPMEKQKVILTLPYPVASTTDFGMVSDEAGVDSLSFSAAAVGNEQALNHRYQAVEWYYHQLMQKWQEADLSNLELAGIYWYKETMDHSIPDEDKLVKRVSELVHTNGQKLFWIPYFGSNGYENWQNYGFDHVLLQPNYYANDVPPLKRIDNVGQEAKKYNLGIEIEADTRILQNRYYYDLFYNQLNRAYELGLDKQTTIAYYNGSKTFLLAAKSQVSVGRQIYDDLYMWISGNYEPKK